MFVDAAAIVAILANEEEGQRCSDVISAAANCFTSPVAVWEAVLALTRANKLACDIPTGREYVASFLEQRAVQIRDLPPPANATQLSLEAAHRFGSGKRRLNVADCFHYACARHYNVPILSTDDEFRLTDLATVP